jgi:hypothetical protein
LLLVHTPGDNYYRYDHHGAAVRRRTGHKGELLNRVWPGIVEKRSLEAIGKLAASLNNFVGAGEQQLR